MGHEGITFFQGSLTLRNLKIIKKQFLFLFTLNLNLFF